MLINNLVAMALCACTSILQPSAACKYDEHNQNYAKAFTIFHNFILTLANQLKSLYFDEHQRSGYYSKHLLIFHSHPAKQPIPVELSNRVPAEQSVPIGADKSTCIRGRQTLPVTGRIEENHTYPVG